MEKDLKYTKDGKIRFLPLHHLDNFKIYRKGYHQNYQSMGYDSYFIKKNKVKEKIIMRSKIVSIFNV